jgi:hypothetical protein
MEHPPRSRYRIFRFTGPIDLKAKQTGRARPPYLRALGRAEPPAEVEVDGVRYFRREVFKHDSWAATAVYGDSPREPYKTENRIVCKFNRRAPIGWIPFQWLGRWLARRETAFLTALQGVSGIPQVYRDVYVDGQIASNVSAHAYVAGRPLSLSSCLNKEFFHRLDCLLDELHKRRIAYVDLHKQENVLVGDDGAPYLIDFQVSLRVANWKWLNPLLRRFVECDRYHVAKHREAHGMREAAMVRPWIIRMHRKVGVPLRTFRRRLLVWLGVRRGDGYAASEVAPEVGLRT